MSVLELDSLTKIYGSFHAVDDVNFRLAQGEVLALLGHNGAGKTTLMKLMLGLTRPSAGWVAVLGQDPAAADLAFRRQLGFLPENVAFHDEMTGRDTLRFFARLKREPVADCARLLDRVGLAFAADRRVKTYSKGMRQRLGLAQALLGQPRLLLLDEPTTGLDPVLRQEFFRIIQDLKTEGCTVVLSSHILTELESRTDLIAIMRGGKLVAWGSLPELRRAARLPVRLLLTTPGHGHAVAERLNGMVVRADADSVDLHCALPDKMAALRAVAELGTLVTDADIELPSLDDIYVHYGHSPEEPALS